MKRRLKVLHVTPTYFSQDSVLGGGERYVLELAKAMSLYADVKILSFGKKNYFYSNGAVVVSVKKPFFYIKNNILNPFYLNLYNDFKEADVIHVHQIYTVLTEVCLIWARLLGKPIFLTDHGGGGSTYLTRFGISRLATGLLTVSEYSSQKLKDVHSHRMPIYGGVDTGEYFPMENISKISNKIITIGRILPHKGLHHLIAAINEETLTIIGQVKDEDYLKHLKKLSENKKVIFLHSVEDEVLKAELASSSLAIFPSSNIGIAGEILRGEPELLGIAPLEAMAMNIPVIVSNIGAYPEICFDKNLFMFENGNVGDLRQKIDFVLNNSSFKKLNFIEHVKTKFTWDKSAKKCLQFYQENGGEK